MDVVYGPVPSEGLVRPQITAGCGHWNFSCVEISYPILMNLYLLRT